MNWVEITFLLTLLVYCLAAVSSLIALIGRRQHFHRLAYCSVLVAFILHTVLLLGSVISSNIPEATRAFFLVPLVWLLVLATLTMRHWLRIDMLLLFATPIAFTLLFVSLVLQSTSATFPATLTGPMLYLHLICIFTGIGMITIAAGAGCFFLWQERNIKCKTPLTGFSKDLPALNALDKINAISALIGFPAYTLGLICGVIWAKVNWGGYLSGDFKEIITIFIWVMYAGLFRQRQAMGWRGRKPALMAICLFLVSIFSLLVVNSFFYTHHGFARQL